MSEAIEPFEVRIDDSELDELRRRLAATRFPDPLEDTGWEAGTPVDVLRDWVGHWRDAYDWRAQEALLNGFEHFRTRIDGLSIHFLHARSPHPDALPLLLSHGWPGSVVEFLDAIPRLTHPEEHGATAADAFHVVAPSLPGYGFSERPRERGWDVPRIARAFAALMARLGYARYGAQGGDWGAQVTTRLGALDAAHLVGIHLNMPIGVQPEDGAPLDEAGRAELARMARFQAEESGYALEQGTKPQTVGAALQDSPAGLLAWILEKFHGWSDCGGDLESVFDRDRLLTNVMLYWLTGTATSSARLYWESRRGGMWSEKPDFVGVPTGVARYPKEVVRFPRAWVERQYRLTRWVEMPRGGHFAAMEQPALFVDDLRAFFADLR